MFHRNKLNQDLGMRPLEYILFSHYPGCDYSEENGVSLFQTRQLKVLVLHFRPCTGAAAALAWAMGEQA
jgi:hypothetical protein